MTEPLFGHSAPMWTAMPSEGFAVQAPTVGNGPLSGPLFGPRAISGVPSATVAVPNVPTSGAPFHSYTPSFFSTDPSAVLVGVRADAMAGMVAAPSLLTVVAMRRGQPQGPTNDQEVEEFIYDALELLPGAADVEVRCEAGRVTLTGTVQHKRVKRDAGEIAWAIPAVQDVQNNIVVSSRRRTRAASRETEAPVSSGGRKQS
jgi:hypothetical protein